MGRQVCAKGEKMAENFFERFCRFFATGFGAGYTPKAPGTAGAVIGIPVGLAINQAPGPGASFLLLLLGVVFSCVCAHVTEKSLGLKDPQVVVIDEIIGMAISLWLLPASVTVILVQFVLFRLFDIYKPFPVKQMEDIFRGGAGIVLDDVMAGILANILFRAGGLILS